MPRTAPANPLFLRDEAIDLHFDWWLLAQAAVQNSYSAALAERDLDPLDFLILVTIDRHQGITMAVLVELCGRPKQVMSRRLQLLEERQLIARIADKIDRRRRLLQLTPDGDQIKDLMMQRIRRHLRAAFSASGIEAVQGFAGVVANLADKGMVKRFGMTTDIIKR